MDCLMPTLQIRDVPLEIYTMLKVMVEKEGRSLAKQALEVIKIGLQIPNSNQLRRQQVLKKRNPSVFRKDLPDPVKLIREDRDR